MRTRWIWRLRRKNEQRTGYMNGDVDDVDEMMR